MKKIFIVGGSGFAKECYIHLSMVMAVDKDITFGGFLGHNGYGDSVHYNKLQHFYLGEVANHNFNDDEYVVIGAALPHLRKTIYDELKARDIKFYTLKTPDIILNEFIEIGEANIFVPPFSASIDVKIGNGNVFNSGIAIGHDVAIGDLNFFAPYTKVLGSVKVGNLNQFGVNAIVLPNSKIGNNNKIAPLGVIYKGCSNNGYYAGNPAIKQGDVE